jgi:hypothetical protein
MVIAASGMTAPEESKTDPVTAPNCPWAQIHLGRVMTAKQRAIMRKDLCMELPP